MSSGTLNPTTDAILEQCPRFRILLVGKSGVGKSSLINEAFSVDKATVSHLKSGVSDIEEEIISPENHRFVLHDSQGFEAGSKGNLDVVKRFVKSRSGNGVDIKEQVHAVWLCIQIPLAGGRVFETGDEEFLKFADQVNVPVIIVFTQYDELFRQTEENLTDEEMEMDIEEICLQKTTDEFKRLCLDPLSKFMPNAPYAETSVKEGFRDTLKTLVNLTQELVERRVEGDVWIVSAMAQRTSARAKVDSSIAVGMKRYWQGLASSANFPGWTLEKCLSTIHTDIASCWNFYDPEDLLNSQEFQDKIKALMQLVVPDPSEVDRWFKGVEHIQSITSIVTALAAPLAPAITAIGLSAMFISWVKSMYDKTPQVLRCLMSYITNLTFLMDQLFLCTLASKPPRRLTKEIVDMAVEGYTSSEFINSVHHAIRKYVDESNWTEILRSNHAEEKVKELIRSHLKL